MSSSSSPSSSTWNDVFLSFRGEDTRRTFVSHLYLSLVRKGIRVFRDESDKIPEPSEIHQAVILKASKIALVVISENYASSRWCLEELAKILECHRKGSLTVFPVYYGIEPRDVIGKPVEFAVYHRRNPKVAVETWRKSLIDLVCIPGEHSNQWEDEAELIRKITDDIWNMLSSSRFSGLVGMDRRMFSVYQLLHLDSKEEEVGIIGIWGRAGLGKRTLAKFVYREISHRFDVCVLLESVDMIHHGHNPLDLSQLLLTKFTNALASPDMISRDATGRRVLLVVEGVGTVEQIGILRKVVKQFSTWSRVIVTCEDQNLLFTSGITLLYQVQPLTFEEAFELLSLHIFNQTHPLEGFEVPLTRAARVGNGFPWEIAAVGSELVGRTKKDWETFVSTYEEFKAPKKWETLFSTYEEFKAPKKWEPRFGVSDADDRYLRENKFGVSDPEDRYLRENRFGVSDDEDRSLTGNTTTFNCVGMDCHIQAVCGGLMELESDIETRIVGIWGVGGVGKTTLARLVYEETMRDFQTHVFLENINQDHGSSRLQEEFLWENIQRSLQKESNVTKVRLRYRKVLLIVEDVGNYRQLEDVKKVATWFGAGSRVIVTTRDENLLKDNGVEHVYEVKCLKIHEALQLFYEIAFKQQTPSSHFKQLSISAVQLAGRIPLAIKVLGLFLQDKNENEWERVLQKLERREESVINVGVSSDEEEDDCFSDSVSDESWEEPEPSTMDNQSPDMK